MPFLEVLSSPSPQPAVGRRLELSRPSLAFDLGSDPSLKLCLDSPVVAQRHGRIERTGGHWSFRALHSHPTTWLDGVRLRSHQPRPLVHGSVLELSKGGVVLAYSERDEVWPREPSLEEALAEAPDDEARWLVWSDFLQERGDPLGGLLAQGGGDEAARARTFGVLARAWVEDELSVEQNRFGAATRVQLRPALARAEDPAGAAWVLRHLGRSKLTFLCQHLDLGVFVGAKESPAQHLERARTLLAALAESPPLPALRGVSAGHGPFAFELEGVEAELEAVRRRHPRVDVGPLAVYGSATLFARLVAVPKRLYVEGLAPGGRVALERTQRHTFGGKPGFTFSVKGTFGVTPPAGSLVLTGRGGPWTVSRSTGMDPAFVRLNGHEVASEAVVMPGDELEFGMGLVFRIEGA